MQLDKLTEQYKEEAIDLFISVFTKEPWNDVYESRDQVVRFFRDYMQDNYYLGYVLLDGGQIIGLCIGAKKPWLQGVEYYIDQFCIDTKRQHSGLGSEFLRLIEEDSRAQGLDGIILMTDRGFPSERFYLKNGFREMTESVVLVK